MDPVELISELGRLCVSSGDPADLTDFIDKRIIGSFGGKYYMVWLIGEEGQTIQPFLYSKDEELVGNLYTDKLVNTAFKLNDGVWNHIQKTKEPAIVNLDELMKGKVTPEWAPLWYNQGIKEMLCSPFGKDQNIRGFFCLYGNRISAVAGNDFSLLKMVTVQVFVFIKLLLQNQTITKLRDQIAGLQSEAYRNSAPGVAEAIRSRGIIGSGGEIMRVIGLISAVAPSDSTVLIFGETGTGKELVSRAIHHASPRKDRQMIKVNCAALPGNLIESELFGHEKGSFTGALERRIGKFERADGGTIFLDEIGELPLELQVRLLRVLQEKEIERIGGTGTFKVDVRVIAATNRDLQKEVAEGRFRSDLYYRLNIFPITLPPLYKRKEDIPELVSHFIGLHAQRTGKKISVSTQVMRKLQAYSWPGNIRELENLVQRGLLHAVGDKVTEIELPQNDIIQKAEKSPRFSVRTLAEMEKAFILETVKHCGGKISGPQGAAKILGIPSTTLTSKMKKLGIKKEHFYLG